VSGESITIDVMPEDTFYDLKTRIQNESGIQLDLEQLNFKGKKITDDQIVAEYFFDGLYEFLCMYHTFIAVYIECAYFSSYACLLISMI
jgi:hypothetical protein